MTADLTPDVMMPIVMARLLRDGETVFHGVASPLPMVAILIAKRLHAPNLVYLNITGSINPQPESLPRSTVDPALFAHTRSRVTLTDLFDLSARGKLDTAFLSGVQIDRHGNINMSLIPGPSGDVHRPKVRLPGGAGSAAIMPSAGRTILWRTKHDVRTFVEAVSFRTSGGRVDRVVTPLCVFCMQDGELQVESIHPYVTAEQVRAQTGWPIAADERTPRTPPPTPAEIDALHAVDPDNVRAIEF
ncbi:MAG: CoA-transferase [Chloroflexi bacterium]|nr:CoA-transferase [Chloroflexota bacterium]